MISEIKNKNYNKIMQFTLNEIQKEIKENSTKVFPIIKKVYENPKNRFERI